MSGSTRRRVAAAAAAVSAVLALGAALLAFDVDRARDAIRDGDLEHARADVSPSAWQLDPRLPGDVAEGLLGLSDDLEFRRGVALFSVSRPEAGGIQAADSTAASHAALRALTAAAAEGEGGERAAQAANLAGVLAAEASGAAVGASPDETAADLFRNAITLDPASEHAKRNLERLLRAAPPPRLVDESPRERGSEGRLQGGAGLSPPGEGY
jgi:hypothetical protein